MANILPIADYQWFRCLNLDDQSKIQYVLANWRNDASEDTQRSYQLCMNLCQSEDLSRGLFDELLYTIGSDDFKWSARGRLTRVKEITSEANRSIEKEYITRGEVIELIYAALNDNNSQLPPKTKLRTNGPTNPRYKSTGNVSDKYR